jgi:uncharacterized iron-regulated membrane protein
MDGIFYRTVWRWHFYAGLFVMPMVLLLAATGAVFLWKPQIDRWEERAFHGPAGGQAVLPSAQRAAALAAFPDARLVSYRLPERPGDAAMVHIALPGGEGMRDVFVSPQGRVLGALDAERRLTALDQKLHGQLLVGRPGSWLVELAASWAIVMIATGLALWWPRGAGLAGVLWPRLHLRGRLLWRDVHAVTGLWVSAFALVLLLTGLPWADAWGHAFKAARTELGLVKGEQDWTLGGRAPDAGRAMAHGQHDHAAMLATARDRATEQAATFDRIVARARLERLAFPVLVQPPGTAGGVWTVKSETQNRPLRATLRLDGRTGALRSREDFADKHVVDRVVGYGIAWHEGQLFGLANQLIGTATALALIALSVTGFLLWRRRGPGAGLGPPPRPTRPRLPTALAIVLAACLVWLPLFAASLALLWLLDRFFLPRLPGVSRWLGRTGAPA